MFKDVQCTFCLIHGSGPPGTSIYTCTDLGQQWRQRAGRAVGPVTAALRLLRTPVKCIQLKNNAERSPGKVFRERSPQRRASKGKGRVQEAGTTALLLGRLWRGRRCALFAGFSLIVHEALAHKVLVVFNMLVKALKLADLEGQDAHQYHDHQ